MITKGQGVEYGVHVGVNSSKYVDGDASIFIDNSSKTGYELGFDVKYTFKRNVVLSSGLNLVQVGGKFAGLGDFYDFSNSGQVCNFPEINTKIMALELPIKVGYKFNIGRSFAITPNVGVYARYGIASIKDDIRTKDNTNNEKWNCFKDYQKSYTLEAFKRFDAGVTADVTFSILKHYNVGVSYKRGFVSQQSEYTPKNQSLSVLIGYTF